jgi:hypothetical protein
MTYDPQDFEASLLPSEDLIMSMSPGDYVVIGGLNFELRIASCGHIAGRLWLSALNPSYTASSAVATHCGGFSPHAKYLGVDVYDKHSRIGVAVDKQRLAKSIAAGEFWIG